MSASTSVDLIGNRFGNPGYRRNVITITTNTTGYDIPAVESGAIYYLARQSTIQMRLPKISSLSLGLTYEFVVKSPPDADGVTIMVASTADSSAHLIGVYTSASTISTAQEAALETTEFDGFCRVTAVSTIEWMFESNAQVEQDGGGAIADGFGGWTTGSTST